LAESAEFIAAIDQGTTSTRCMIFDHDGAEVARHQLEHEQILPRAGWVEHDPVEIWERASSVLTSVLNRAKLTSKDLVALGITPDGPITTRSSGRTPAPTGSRPRWTETVAER
jgi:glycerol kinase